MYLDCTIKIPDSNGKITKKTIKGTTYIYYEYARIYLKDKKYNTPRRICIGKQIPGQPALMLPNDKFLKIFPQEILPEEKQGYRSGCLRIGAYIVIRKVISDYRLDLMLARIVGKDAGLFLDLAAYTIITEGNAAQYYLDYASNHPLMTGDMRIYSDSKVSDFLSRTTTDQRILFLNEWNEKRDHRERIYISYDSTNKNSQAGDIDLVEFGHPKDDQGKEIFNYSIAYDRNNREPLFYESYPGSIVDISQLQYTLGKAKGYGYRRVGFILDRGYFSKENIRFMDDNGYDFVIMAKGMKKLVSDIILERRGRFEDDRKNSIRAYKVSGTTVCIFRPSESKETVGVSPPSREKQVQVHGRESTGVLFWKEMAKERFAKRSSACHLFRLESFSFAHGVISIDEDLVGTVLNPVQHSIC